MPETFYSPLILKKARACGLTPLQVWRNEQSQRILQQRELEERRERLDAYLRNQQEALGPLPAGDEPGTEAIRD